MSTALFALLATWSKQHGKRIIVVGHQSACQHSYQQQNKVQIAPPQAVSNMLASQRKKMLSHQMLKKLAKPMSVKVAQQSLFEHV